MFQALTRTKLVLVMTGLLVLTGCSHVGPYVPPVQQGTILEAHAASQLHIGMSKSQVIDIIGYPVVNDPYNNYQWTYVYELEKNGQPVSHHYLVVHFSAKGRVSKIITDETQFAKKPTLPTPVYHSY